MKEHEKKWNPETYYASFMDTIPPIENVIRPNILSVIPLKRGDSVLECGIGSGKWSAAFALLGCEVYAMDNSEDMLENARVNFPNISIQYILKDIREPDLIDPPVDLIFNEGVLEHFIDDSERKQVLANLYDAVKGYISLIVPYKSREEDEIAYTKDKLGKEVEEVGFKVLNFYPITFLSGDKVTIRNMIGVNAVRTRHGGDINVV